MDKTVIKVIINDEIIFQHVMDRLWIDDLKLKSQVEPCMMKIIEISGFKSPDIKKISYNFQHLEY